MSHRLPKLPFAYDALEPYIDKKTMTIHHTKHHAGYVKKLNDALTDFPKFQKLKVDELIKNLNKLPTKIKADVRKNGGGHANHSLFWKVMAPKPPGGSVPARSILAEAINSIFGDIESLKEKFTNAALQRFSNGWAWLVVDLSTNSGHVVKLKVESTANHDSPFLKGRMPILVIDVWEHAYYLKYQNRRADYIASWWNVVNWKQVSKNFTRALKQT